MILSPRLAMQEVITLRGHLPRWVRVKDIAKLTSEYHYGIETLYSFDVESLKSLEEKYVFCPNDWEHQPAVKRLFGKSTPERWRVRRRSCYFRNEDIEITDLAIADRYIVTKKEMVM